MIRPVVSLEWPFSGGTGDPATTPKFNLLDNGGASGLEGPNIILEAEDFSMTQYGVCFCGVVEGIEITLSVSKDRVIYQTGGRKVIRDIGSRDATKVIIWLEKFHGYSSDALDYNSALAVSSLNAAMRYGEATQEGGVDEIMMASHDLFPFCRQGEDVALAAVRIISARYREITETTTA